MTLLYLLSYWGISTPDRTRTCIYPLRTRVPIQLDYRGISAGTENRTPIIHLASGRSTIEPHLLEQDTRIELVSSVWKTDVMAVIPILRLAEDENFEIPMPYGTRFQDGGGAFTL